MTPRAPWRLVLGVSLVAWTPITAYAGAAPRWVRDEMPHVLAEAGSDDPAVILYDRTDVRVDGDLGVEVRRRRIARILKPDGVAPASIHVYVEPGGDLVDIQAWTISREGLRGSAGRSQLIQSQTAEGSYSDARIVSIAPPGAQPGDIVAFEASWKEREPFPLHHWMPQPENLPVTRAELEIDLPGDWSAEIHGYHLATAPPSPQAGHVQVALNDLRPLPDEPLRPDDSVLLPRVLVRYVDPGRKRVLNDWNRIAAFTFQMMREPSSKAACPTELGAVAMRGPTSQRLNDLARLVQQDVRYVAIELGMQRWVPDAALATWQRRYGDCKDKAALLVSALAANGIDARVALVCTRERWEVDPESPDLQFNHAIVAIVWPGEDAPGAATATGPSGRHWTFFDPTDTATPLGSISHSLGTTWGVIADPSEGLVQLPAATPLAVAQEVRGRLSPGGALIGTLTLWGVGAAGEALIARYGPFDPAERRRRAAEFLLARWPQATLDSCHLAAPAGRGNRAGVHMDFRLPGVAHPMNGAWLVTPALLSAWTTPCPRDTARTLPLLLGTPGVVEEDWEVELPAGVVAEQRRPVSWSGPIADYSMSVGGSPGKLALSRRLELRMGEVPADQFGQGRALWRAVYSGDHLSILLTKR